MGLLFRLKLNQLGAPSRIQVQLRASNLEASSWRLGGAMGSLMPDWLAAGARNIGGAARAELMKRQVDAKLNR